MSFSWMIFSIYRSFSLKVSHKRSTMLLLFYKKVDIKHWLKLYLFYSSFSSILYNNYFNSSFYIYYNCFYKLIFVNELGNCLYDKDKIVCNIVIPKL